MLEEPISSVESPLEESPLDSVLAASQRPERLLALHQYDILDTPSEQAFDDLTQLAASLCKVPVAIITFVDGDRQYFKSAFGAQMTTAPLEQGFCPFVVEQGQPLVVTDAPNDAKFHSHPAIESMGLRFYAGVPLITAQAQAIGTICIVDFEPRQLNADQIDNLQALSRQVMHLLDLRLSARQVAITNGALTAVSYGLAATSGDAFFESLVQQFTEALGVDFAYISLIDRPEPTSRMKTLAVCHQGKIVDNFEYDLQHTPCAEILKRRSLCWHDRELAARFPKMSMLADLGMESYAAIPIFDHRREPLGVLGVMDTKPLNNPHLTESLLTIFSLRLSTELQRQRDQAQQADLLAQAQTARQQAEKANRIKDEFLAVVSHELRSPLNPIVGWAQILRKGTLPPEKTNHALGVIERNAKLQVQLIDDLLDVSRILRGKLSLQKAPVSLAPTIIAAIETVQLAAEAKAITIRTQLPIEPIMVNGDAGRLQQIVWNLLSNAVKFIPEGGQITVSLSVVSVALMASSLAVQTAVQTDNKTAIQTDGQVSTKAAQIEVTDTGIGIQPDFLPYVFERFRQEDYSTTRKFGGLGLGLAIVQQLVTSHGGTIHATSAGTDKGTTFTVQIPLDE